MTEEFEYKGKWFLPEDPKNTIEGILKFTPSKGANLDLEGVFPRPKNMQKVIKPKIILGYSNRSEKITMYECLEENITYIVDSGGQKAIKSSFYAHLVFVGNHFYNEEDIFFNRLHVHLTNLDEWVSISGIDIKYEDEGNDFNIEYIHPKPIKLAEFEDFRLFLEFSVTPPPISTLNEINIKQTTYILFESKTEKHFNNYRDLIFLMQIFLGFATSEPVYPLRIMGENKSIKLFEKDGISCNKPIDIIFQLSDFGTIQKKIFPFDMLFNFNDINDKIEKCIYNWLNKEKKLRAVYELYFFTIMNPQIYLENKFLSLAFALEAYVRKKMRTSELLKEEHRKRIKYIIDSIEKEDIKIWTEKKLVYSNELTLREKIYKIFEKFSGLADRLIPDWPDFAKQVADTRNYYVHREKPKNRKIVKGQELFILTERLKMLIEIILLNEIGFSNKDIVNLITRNRKYTNFIEAV